MAFLIPSPGIGVWSRERPVFHDVGSFLGFTGISSEPGVMTSAATATPRLFRFPVHVTRWNSGEAECSRTRFLDMVKRRDMRVGPEFLVMVSEGMPIWRPTAVLQ